MGESGGSSLTGPRLHQVGLLEAKMTAGGAWRRPRMKVYDYNQEFGGNYYQPMIQYVNHYISELSIVKGGNHKLDTKYRKHLAMIEACEDEYNYHHKLFGQGAVDRDFQFHNPQLVKDYVNQIRRV